MSHSESPPPHGPTTNPATRAGSNAPCSHGPDLDVSFYPAIPGPDGPLNVCPTIEFAYDGELQVSKSILTVLDFAPHTPAGHATMHSLVQYWGAVVQQAKVMTLFQEWVGSPAADKFIQGHMPREKSKPAVETMQSPSMQVSASMPPAAPKELTEGEILKDITKAIGAVTETPLIAKVMFMRELANGFPPHARRLMQDSKARRETPDDVDFAGENVLFFLGMSPIAVPIYETPPKSLDLTIPAHGSALYYGALLQSRLDATTKAERKALFFDYVIAASMLIDQAQEQVGGTTTLQQMGIALKKVAIDGRYAPLRNIESCSSFAHQLTTSTLDDQWAKRNLKKL